MNRNLLLQVTAPTVLIGLLLFTVCLVGAWFTDRSQRELAKLLSQEVASLQAAQELEIRVGQLRFHEFLYLRSRSEPERARSRRSIKDQCSSISRGALDKRPFRSAARLAEKSPVKIIDTIQQGYQLYQRRSWPSSLQARRKAAGTKPRLRQVLANSPSDPAHRRVPVEDLLRHQPLTKWPGPVHESEEASALPGSRGS